MDLIAALLRASLMVTLEYHFNTKQLHFWSSYFQQKAERQRARGVRALPAGKLAIGKRAPLKK